MSEQTPPIDPLLDLAANPEPTAEPGTGASKVLRDWLIVIGVALVAALLVRVYVLQQFYISGPSMETTMYSNDRVLVNKMSYRLHDVHRGDVVVFDRITTNGATVAHDDLIKRVIGLEGEHIEIKNCVVFIDDEALNEDYLPARDTEKSDLTQRCRVPNMRRITIPAHHVFVMGDNRPESFDSRSFGSIPESLIVGRAFAVVWPLSRFDAL
jgi:signal peptidase I